MHQQKLHRRCGEQAVGQGITQSLNRSHTTMSSMERNSMNISIESLLAARLFLSPKLLGNRLFFLSNLGPGGHLSLYAMDTGGSVPEPLLPARIAVPKPDLAEAEVFASFPSLARMCLGLGREC